jgi:hypothetical protein
MLGRIEQAFKSYLKSEPDVVNLMHETRREQWAGGPALPALEVFDDLCIS